MAFWLNSVVDEATTSTKTTYRRVLLQLTPASLERLCRLTSPSPAIVRVVGVVRSGALHACVGVVHDARTRERRAGVPPSARGHDLGQRRVRDRQRRVFRAPAGLADTDGRRCEYGCQWVTHTIVLGCNGF